MRRQVGAEDVEIDAREGWVRFSLLQPRLLDFERIDRALHSAGYTLARLDIELEMVLERGARQLRVPQTDQRFRLGDGERTDVTGAPLVAGERRRVRGAVSSWMSGNPLITLGPPPQRGDLHGRDPADSSGS